MGQLVTYEQFKEYQRKKKYGDRPEKLRRMNFPDDFNPFEDEIDDEFLYGQQETDEDFWLGVKSLDEIFKE